MWLVVVLFCLGLLCLIKGGDWFVDGATGIAERFHVPELLIGATVVSIGTTLPETMVSATSAVEGVSSIAYGNAIGSIICNTALVSGLTIAIAPSVIDKKPLKMPVAFFFGSALFYAGMAYFFGGFSRLSGLILLAGFCVYMTILVRQAIVQGKQIGMEKAESEQEIPHKDVPLWKDILLLIVGAALIAVGARLLVDNGTKIAEALGVPETVIAVTFVALGTSLPELVTGIVSLVKGHGALSLGNIVGANLLNVLLVSGLAITLRPFEIPGEKLIAGMNASLVVDIPMMFTVMILMTIPALITGKLKRYQGILLLALYAGYCVFQFA
ncbi:MAG: calcium/sodium antiporter [Lachnospiraceae bacterium]|nr:calcium/sodium antiporter [Lachnospiraceae bacterium]